jgi:hypothetical protein
LLPEPGRTARALVGGAADTGMLFQGAMVSIMILMPANAGRACNDEELDGMNRTYRLKSESHAVLHPGAGKRPQRARGRCVGSGPNGWVAQKRAPAGAWLAHSL